MKWNEINIGDIGEVITGNTPLTTDREFYGGQYPFIKPTDMEIDRRHVAKWEENYSEKAFKKYKNAYIPPGSTGVVTIGTVGEKIFQADRHCFTNQSVNVVIPNKTKYDPDFVYYLLKYNLPKVSSANPGTASGRHHVSKSNFSSIKVIVPSEREVQARIGEILSPYDDLIERNLKRINSLEELAQRTFEDWYKTGKWTTTPLRNLVGYEIGGGWGADNSSDDFPDGAFVIRGTDINKIPSGDIEGVPYRYHKNSNLTSRRLQNGDIIFEVSGGSSNEGVAKTLLVTDSLLNQFDDSVMCASFCKLLRPKELQLSNFLFLFLRYLRQARVTEIFEIRSASNIVNYNWTAFLKFQEVKVPGDESLMNLNKIIEPVYDQIYNLGKQNRLLKEARDILMPRLMNGVIDVTKFSQNLALAAEPETNYKN